MRNLVAIPLLGLAVIAQSAIVAQFSLLAGYADLVLVMLAAWALQERVNTAFHWAFLASVMIGLVSRLPWFVYFAGYGGTVVLALVLQRRVWQVPMLAMFSVTFLGALWLHLLSYLYLTLSGDPISFTESLGLVTLPSVLLNMLIAIPLFGIMRDLARWVFSYSGAT
jgi:hypothetical protein